MKFLYSFLIMLIACAGFAVPIPGLVHSFATDERTDHVYTVTGAGDVTASIVLFKAVYADDASTLSVNSSASESPVITGYTAATKTVAIGGLTANATRTLYLSYEVDALTGSTFWETVLDLVPYLYYLLLVCLMAASIAVMFMK